MTHWFNLLYLLFSYLKKRGHFRTSWKSAKLYLYSDEMVTIEEDSVPDVEIDIKQCKHMRLLADDITQTEKDKLPKNTDMSLVIGIEMGADKIKWCLMSNSYDYQRLSDALAEIVISFSYSFKRINLSLSKINY